MGETLRSRQARIMRTAISPRFATKILRNIGDEGLRPEVRNQKSEIRSQNTPLSTQHSVLSTQYSVLGPAIIPNAKKASMEARLYIFRLEKLIAWQFCPKVRPRRRDEAFLTLCR